MQQPQSSHLFKWHFHCEVKWLYLLLKTSNLTEIIYLQQFFIHCWVQSVLNEIWFWMTIFTVLLLSFTNKQNHLRLQVSKLTVLAFQCNLLFLICRFCLFPLNYQIINCLMNIYDEMKWIRWKSFRKIIVKFKSSSSYEYHLYCSFPMSMTVIKVQNIYCLENLLFLKCQWI